MEKASKILVFIFFLGVAYLAWSVFTFDERSKAEVIDMRTIVEGKSMLPTLHNGDFVHYSPVDQPVVGNIVLFSCDSDRCLSSKGHTFIKRLSAIHDGCYQFTGDNPDESFDSRHFGELCGDEVKIQGVVTSIELSNNQ